MKSAIAAQCRARQMTQTDGMLREHYGMKRGEPVDFVRQVFTSIIGHRIVHG